jgi:hypothetical protein
MDLSNPKQQRGLNGSHETSPLMIPRLESMECQTPLKLLGSHTNDAKGDDHATADPLMQALINRLPKPEGIWSLDDRAKWLRTAANIFSLVYRASDGEVRDVSVVLVKQEPANSPVTTELGPAETKRDGLVDDPDPLFSVESPRTREEVLTLI